MSNPDESSSNTGISGPGFIVLLVRDVEAAANFYEQKIGFKRDPQAFPGAVAFLTSPIPLSVTQAPPAVNLDRQPCSNPRAMGRLAGRSFSLTSVVIPYESPCLTLLTPNV